MKLIKYILPILLIFSLTEMAWAQLESFDWDKKGEQLHFKKVLTDTTSNNLNRKDTVFVDIKDYSKFTFYTGSSQSDSAHYQFELWGGVGGMWKKIWHDSITTTSAKSGTITTDAKIFTYDMETHYIIWDADSISVTSEKSYDLFTELKWIRRTMATGNGSGPLANRTKANDFIIGYRRVGF